MKARHNPLAEAIRNLSDAELADALGIPNGMPVDAMDALCDRAEAVAVDLIEETSEAEGLALSPAHVAQRVDAIAGYIRQMRMIARAWHAAEVRK